MYFFIFITNTINMLVAIIIVLVVFIILFMPIKLKTKISYNILENAGIVSLYIGCVKMFLGRFNFGFNRFNMTYSKSKIYSTSFTDIKNGSTFMDKFIVNIYKRIKIKTIKIYANLGIKSDAYLTAILVGCVDVPIQILSALVLNQKAINRVSTRIFANFCDNSLFFGVAGCIKLNLFLIIYCCIVSLFKINQGVNAYEN